MLTSVNRLGRAIAGVQQGTRSDALHQSFLAFSRFRYLKLAGMAAIASVLIYAADRPYESSYGGSWAGYVLGTVAALLILWLTWFGYRKRSYADIHARLTARLSAHVYFGGCLLLVATLHTGFHFGLNIHTLAYGLMCLVIATGVLGVFCYAQYPRLMTENRAGMTMQQMLGRIASLDDELRQVALPLEQRTAMVVEFAAETTAIGGSAWRQLSGRFPKCATTAAIEYFDANAPGISAELDDVMLRVRVLLGEKALLLARVRRDLHYKAIVDGWLYLHVPLSFMLIAALLAHIISVFFFW
jgi:hypothetical protein